MGFEALEGWADRIKQHPKLIFADDFEIVIQSVVSERHSFRNGVGADSHRDGGLWVSLRVLHRKSAGRAVVTQFSEHSVDALVESAFHSAKISQGDPWFRFPLWRKPDPIPEPTATPWEEPSTMLGATPPGIALVDEVYDQREEMTTLHRKTERFHLKRYRRWLGSRITVVAECGGGILGLEEEHVHRDPQERKGWLGSLVKDASAYRMAPQCQPVSGKISLLTSPHVTAALLGYMAPQFCSDRLRKGQSSLKVGETPETFSTALTLVDHGNYPGLPLGAAVDLEGSQTRETVLVDRGSLKNFLFDSYEATRENRLSTGNYLRSFGSQWAQIQPSVFFIRPSTTTPASLLGGMGKGIWLERLESLRPMAGATGRLRLRGSGAFVSQGRLQERLREINLEIEVIDLMRLIGAVGNDLRFYGPWGGPSILFEKVPIDRSRSP